MEAVERGRVSKPLHATKLHRQSALFWGWEVKLEGPFMKESEKAKFWLKIHGMDSTEGTLKLMQKNAGEMDDVLNFGIKKSGKGHYGRNTETDANQILGTWMNHIT